MKLSCVLPFYNEAEQLPYTLARLLPFLKKLPCSVELILIDDGSQDATWDLLLPTLSEKKLSVRLLRLSRNFGKEAALCAGLEHASGDAVLLMDGDLQHPLHCIPEFLAQYKAGYPIVEGVKKTRGTESFFKKHSARIFYKLFKRLSDVDLENASDFKLLDREVVEAWKQLKERDTFFRGMVSWLGFPRKVVFFEVEERMQGRSKWSTRNLIRLALQAITSFSSKPLRLVTALGILFLVLAFFLGIHTLVNYCMGRSLSGFTTVILLQLIIGGFLQISLGMISLYLSKIYEEIKGRPRYLLAEDLQSEKQGNPNLPHSTH